MISKQVKPATPFYSLRDFMALAADVLGKSLPALVRIEATLFSIRAVKSGWAIELTEPKALNPSTGASLRVFIGADALRAFEAELGMPIEPGTLAGMQGIVHVRPTYHLRHQLQGQIVGIDPLLSEGLVAKRIDSIRETLRKEGLYGKQKTWVAPRDICAVAIIHPPESAGWSDIESGLRRLEHVGILTIHSIPAAFEGPRAARSLSEALEKAKNLCAVVDLVVMVRGGGAASGLGGAVDLEVARLVCLMPAPVVTGIGHAIDRGLLDELAWHSAHTPTAAGAIITRVLRRRAGDAMRSHGLIMESAGRIIDRETRPKLLAARDDVSRAIMHAIACEEAALQSIRSELRGRLSGLPEKCRDLASRLRRFLIDASTSALELLDRERDGLDRWAAQMARDLERRLRAMPPPELKREIVTRTAATLIERQEGAITRMRDAVMFDSKRLIQANDHRLASMSESLKSLGLRQNLARGYVLALHDGRIVQTAMAASAIGQFELMFQDGSMKVSVCEPGKGKPPLGR